MTIGRICQKNVDVAEPGEPIRVAAHRMGSREVGALIVVDAANKPIGILTDRDVAVRVCGEGRDANLVTVGEVMTRDVHTISERATLESALHDMRAHAIRRLPVVARDGALIGIVTLDDVFGQLAQDVGTITQVLERSSPRVLTEP